VEGQPTAQRPSPLPEALQALYARLNPPLAREDAGPVDPREREAARYLWRAGSYRCGITAYLTFFLLGDFLAHARQARPRRFDALLPFARSFDFTDRFIKQVTDSGRRPSGGLDSPSVIDLLRRIQAAHDRIRVPHWMMVHFGFTLMEQLERDLDVQDPDLLRHHLGYMARAYRTMGLPFSTDRALMETLCRGIEHRFARWEPAAGPCGRRLLFLGQLVGVAPQERELAPLLPEPVRPLFRAHYAEMRPGALTRAAGGLLGTALSPARQYRNPLPGSYPGADCRGTFSE
jgi:hypothetical protein